MVKKSAVGNNSGGNSGAVAAAAPVAPGRMCIRGTLASGKKVVLTELTGSDEIAAAQESENNQALLVMCQILRSMVSLDGQSWDTSMATALGTRDQFSAKDWRMLMEMHAELNLPTVQENETFRAGWERFSSGREDTIS